MKSITRDTVIREVQAKVMKGEKVSISEEMRKAGFSKSYSKHPERLTTSQEWKDEMDLFLPDITLLSKHKNLLNSKNERIALDSLKEGYNIKGKHKDPEAEGGDTIKALLLEVYNDNRQFINEDNNNYKKVKTIEPLEPSEVAEVAEVEPTERIK